MLEVQTLGARGAIGADRNHDLLTALETMIIPEFLLPINIIY
jgi:hypothetical protein